MPIMIEERKKSLLSLRPFFSGLKLNFSAPIVKYEKKMLLLNLITILKIIWIKIWKKGEKGELSVYLKFVSPTKGQLYNL